MAWPDVSRRIWSYIIAKIGVFSNIDPSRLELSSNSLCLTNIEIDAEKLDIPGVTITQFFLEKLQMGISSSGLSINGNSVKIDAKIDSLETPDIAISMFLESTKTDLAELGRASEKTLNTKPSNYFTTKIADLFISQMSARFSDVNIELSIAQNTSLHINISEIFVTSKFRVEFESITVTKIDKFSDVNTDDATESESDGEDFMSKSVYVDARSSLRDIDKAKFESLIESRTSLVAIIEGAIFTYRLDPMSYHIDIENARVDGLRTSEILVLALNDLFYQRSETPLNECGSEVATSSCSMNCLDIYEALEDEALKVFSIKEIAFSESTFTIGSFEVPDVLVASPFLSARLTDPLKFSILVPISAYISSEMFARLKRLASHLSTIFEDLEPPPDTETTPFTAEIPDLRIAIGNNMTIVIFPSSGSEKGLSLREVTARFDDSQLALSGVTILYRGSLSVDSLKLNLENSFYEKFTAFVDLFNTEEKNIAGSDSDRQKRFPHLPDSTLEIYKFDIIDKAANAICAGSLAFRVCNRESKLKFSAKGHVDKSEFQFEFFATSQNRFRKSEAALRCQRLRLDYNQFNFDKGMNHNSERSTVELFATFPVVISSVEFEDDIYLEICNTAMIVHVGKSKLKVSSNGLSLHIPRLYGDLEDPSEAGRRIRLIKVNDFTAKLCAEMKISAGVVVFMSCADSYSYITELLEQFVPSAPDSERIKEPLVSIDTFQDVEDREFVPSNLPSIFQAHLTVGEETDIEIKANYLDHEQDLRKKCTASRGTLSSPDTWDSVSSIDIGKFQWQLFDGFDFKRTRNRICMAIDEVTQVAANIEESSDSGLESAVVGDFMYGSVIIAAQASKVTTLQAEVAKELGSNFSLERSADPKVVATCREIQFSKTFRNQPKRDEVESIMSITVHEGNISDLVSTSGFNFVLWPSKEVDQRHFLQFSQSFIEAADSPESKVEIELHPIHLSFDQDTVEFLARFFQFTDQDVEDSIGGAEVTLNGALSNSHYQQHISFFRSLKFGGLAITIDYMPKKLDYRSLRSGMATELLNVFEVKGAKLKLKPAIFYGLDGWNEAWPTLVDFWMPDIKANQLFSLAGGIKPIRKAVKMGKGVSKRTLAPIKQKEIGKGASIIVRRTLDEILRVATSWLDSTDEAFGAE